MSHSSSIFWILLIVFIIISIFKWWRSQEENQPEYVPVCMDVPGIKYNPLSGDMLLPVPTEQPGTFNMNPPQWLCDGVRRRAFILDDAGKRVGCYSDDGVTCASKCPGDNVAPITLTDPAPYIVTRPTDFSENKTGIGQWFWDNALAKANNLNRWVYFPRKYPSNLDLHRIGEQHIDTELGEVQSMCQSNPECLGFDTRGNLLSGQATMSDDSLATSQGTWLKF